MKTAHAQSNVLPISISVLPSRPFLPVQLAFPSLPLASPPRSLHSPPVLVVRDSAIAAGVLPARFLLGDSLLSVPLAEELNDALVGDLLNVRRERGHFVFDAGVRSVEVATGARTREVEC